MRAASSADSWRIGEDAPLDRPHAQFPWPAFFFLSVAALLVAVIYLCGVVARVLAPSAEAVGVPVVLDRELARAAAESAAVGDITSDGPSESVAELAPDQALQSAIAAALGGHQRTGAGVAVLNLDDGRWAASDPDRVFYAASTFKLAVLYEAERRISTGELALDDRLPLSEEALEEDLGTLDLVPVADDGTVSVGEALEAMITLSDNATAVALLRLLGPGAIDETLRGLGLESMAVNTRGLPASASDLVLLMRAIVSGEGVGAKEREHMRSLLLGQTVRSGIPAALAAESGSQLAIGNKTGTWPGVTNDVAFVEGPAGTYVLAVMAEGDWNWALVNDVSRAVYEAMTTPVNAVGTAGAVP